MKMEIFEACISHVIWDKIKILISTSHFAEKTTENEDQVRIERDVQQLKSMLQCKKPESDIHYRALALIQNNSTRWGSFLKK